MSARIVELARDPDLRGRFGRAGWQRAARHYSWERERAGLLRLFGLGDPDTPHGRAPVP